MIFHNFRVFDVTLTQHKRCLYSEFFWSAFSWIQTEYGDLQKNFEYGHFLRSIICWCHSTIIEGAQSKRKQVDHVLCYFASGKAVLSLSILTKYNFLTPFCYWLRFNLNDTLKAYFCNVIRCSALSLWVGYFYFILFFNILFYFIIIFYFYYLHLCSFSGCF